MHPRTAKQAWTRRRRSKAAEVLAFVRERGPTHPRAVEEHFAHGRRVNCLGRLGTGDDAPARRHALPRPAARAAARQRHAHLRRGRARAGRRQPRRRAASARWRCSIWSCASTRRCPRRAWSTSPACSRYGAPHLQARDPRRARDGARAAGERAARRRRPGTGRPTRTRARRAGTSTSACACSRRSIRSSGTGAASSCSGAGPIASRPTRRRRSESSATTRCRCSGATRSSAGATPR